MEEKRNQDQYPTKITARTYVNYRIYSCFDHSPPIRGVAHCSQTTKAAAGFHPRRRGDGADRWRDESSTPAAAVAADRVITHSHMWPSIPAWLHGSDRSDSWIAIIAASSSSSRVGRKARESSESSSTTGTTSSIDGGGGRDEGSSSGSSRSTTATAAVARSSSIALLLPSIVGRAPVAS